MITAARLKSMKLGVSLLTTAVVTSSLSLGLIADCVHSASVPKKCESTQSVTVQDLSLESQVVETLDVLEPEVEPEVERGVEVEVAPVATPSVQPSQLVEQVVAAESRGETLEGQMAVAQTIYETSCATGQTPDEVVSVPNQYAEPISYDLVTDSVKEACYRVFVLNEKVTEEPIRWFYSTAGGFYSKWHETSSNLEYVMSIGAHKFYKLSEEV